jgi:inosine-uridine nucleoside N-ribohydrolase
MKNFDFWTCLAVILCVLCFVNQEVFAELKSLPKPVSLIYDTDMGNDVDDALALAMIHAMQSRGECRLLAVTLTKDNKYAAPFVDLVNTFYGRGEIPIGVVKGGVTPEDGKYNKQVVTAKKNGKTIYAQDAVSNEKMPEATGLLRKILAGEPDGSVMIAQVGFSTNLARLLESQGDKYSPLSGRELVAKKVKLLSAMAGSFKPINGNKHFLEYNVKMDVPSAKKVFGEWPGPVVMSGFEIGIAVPYSTESINNDYEYVEHHPIKDAYELYCGLDHNRPTWDLTSVLYAVHMEKNYFGLSESGRVTVEDDGFTSFEADSKGTRRYLTMDEAQMIRIREAMNLLCSQPPNK